MIKILVVVGFLVIRYLISANKKKAKQSQGSVSPKREKNKSLDDIFGDFVKEVKSNKSQEFGSTKNDTHRAEEDTEKLDWQEVVKSKFEKPNTVSQSQYTNYNKISNTDTVEQTMEVATVEQEIAQNEIEVDFKQAVIYQTILERKYFKI